MPYVKQKIDTILFWKERHNAAIQSFQASKSNGAATLIRHARKRLDSMMKKIKDKADRLQQMHGEDKALDKSMSTTDQFEEIAKKFQSEAQVF